MNCGVALPRLLNGSTYNGARRSAGSDAIAAIAAAAAAATAAGHQHPGEDGGNSGAADDGFV
jgi:hypothetical protein